MKQISHTALRVAASISASENGAAVEISYFTGNAQITLNSAAMGGTGPTSNVKIQHSDDGSTGWTDTGDAFNQVGAVASFQTLFVSLDAYKKYIRVVNTLGGTSPTQVYGVSLHGVKSGN